MALNIVPQLTLSLRVPPPIQMKNETFKNFSAENDHQISAFKSIFVKHGTLTSLSKKRSSAYCVEDKGKALLFHHLGLTEEMFPLMRIINRLSLREAIISVAWTDYGKVKD